METALLILAGIIAVWAILMLRSTKQHYSCTGCDFSAKRKDECPCRSCDNFNLFQITH